MTQIDLSRFDSVITPRGVRERSRSLRQRGADLHHSLVKVLYLVRLSLHQQSFGLSLGHVWLVLEPSLQAAAYFFLIRVVLGVSGQDMTFAFFFTGITFWRSHAALVTSAPYLLTSKGQTYLEQNMTLETAYFEQVAHEVVLFLIRLLVLLIFLLVAGQRPSLAWLFAVPIGIVMFTFSSALLVWLSVIGLYFKDAGKFIGHAVWLWWYMSPGLYNIKRIPEWFLPIYQLNPFAHIIPALHDCMLDGQAPSNPGALALIFSGSFVALVAGWHVVKKVGYQIARYA